MFFHTPSLHRSKNSAPYPKRRNNVVGILGLEPSSILKLGPILLQNHKMPAPTRPGAGYYSTCKIQTGPANADLTSTNVTADCYVNKLTFICMLRKTLCHKNVMLTILKGALLKNVIIINIDTGQ